MLPCASTVPRAGCTVGKRLRLLPSWTLDLDKNIVKYEYLSKIIIIQMVKGCGEKNKLGRRNAKKGHDCQG